MSEASWSRKRSELVEEAKRAGRGSEASWSRKRSELVEEAKRAGRGNEASWSRKRSELVEEAKRAGRGSAALLGSKFLMVLPLALTISLIHSSPFIPLLLFCFFAFLQRAFDEFNTTAQGGCQGAISRGGKSRRRRGGRDDRSYPGE